MPEGDNKHHNGAGVALRHSLCHCLSRSQAQQPRPVSLFLRSYQPSPAHRDVGTHLWKLPLEVCALQSNHLPGATQCREPEGPFPMGWEGQAGDELGETCPTGENKGGRSRKPRDPSKAEADTGSSSSFHTHGSKAAYPVLQQCCRVQHSLQISSAPEVHPCNGIRSS